MLRIVLCSLTAGLAVNCSGVGAQTGDTRFVHDPVIATSTSGHYAFSTGEGIPIRWSADLVHWEYQGRVFTADVPPWAPTTIPGSTGIWAPDISRLSGRYHLYYSVSTFGSQRSAIGLTTNTTLDPDADDYEWQDRGVVLESVPGEDDFNAIDPNLVLDASGQPWLSWGSYWTGIKLTRIDPATGKPPEGELEIHALAARPGNTAIEAPFLIYREPYYYLFVSFDACCRGVDSTYNIRVGRSETITGPYLDEQGHTMLTGGGTLVLASHDAVRGPGHNSVLQTSNGDYLVHHYYDAADQGFPHLSIRPLLWDNEAWPHAGFPYGGETPPSTDLATELVSGEWNQLVAFGFEMTVRFFPNGHLNTPDGEATWALEGSDLVLTWPNQDAPGGAWVDHCVMATDGSYYVGRNQDSTDIRAIRVQGTNSLLRMR